jgi:SAM-dependent methyltransferase
MNCYVSSVEYPVALGIFLVEGKNYYSFLNTGSSWRQMSHRICPWWLGPLLASPLRRFLYSPEKLLSPYVDEGMTALDIGCGMGFFSLPLARMVGPTGKVVCVDLQEKMLNGLVKRAMQAGLFDRIDARLCRKDALQLDDLAGRIDFALACAIMHEVPDKSRLLSEICKTMKKDGRLLIIEPSGHVGTAEFDNTVQIAQTEGFEPVDRPDMRRSRAVLLRKS